MVRPQSYRVQYKALHKVIPDALTKTLLEVLLEHLVSRFSPNPTPLISVRGCDSTLQNRDRLLQIIQPEFEIRSVGR